MTCYHPITAYKSLKSKTVNDKSVILFQKKHKLDAEKLAVLKEIKLPCGKCIGCRISRSQAWALRCLHEASLYEYNCFITLTFNNENLNEYQELEKADFQNFMKRLRSMFKGLSAVGGKYPIRYFHCGEYGNNLMRPHHHACLFNFDFLDKQLWKVRDGVRLYRSPSLEKLWPYGFSTVGEVTYQSAAYVARYCMKKIDGLKSALHYVNQFKVDKETGEMLKIQPEYITMSRRPGIGRRWYEKFKTDLYPKDFVTVNGSKKKVPQYYDKIYDIEYPEEMQKIKKIRVAKQNENVDNNSNQRLRVRETVTEKRVKKLIRSYES